MIRPSTKGYFNKNARFFNVESGQTNKDRFVKSVINFQVKCVKSPLNVIALKIWKNNQNFFSKSTLHLADSQIRYNRFD